MHSSFDKRLSSFFHRVLLQVLQNRRFLFNLSTIVLSLLLGNLHFKPVILQLFLLSLYLKAKFYVLFLESVLLALHTEGLVYITDNSGFFLQIETADIW